MNAPLDDRRLFSSHLAISYQKIGRVHICAIDSEQLPEFLFGSLCDSIVPRDEVQVSTRYRLEQDRRNYLCARIACRLLLSSLLDRPPTELQLHKTRFGRPELFSALPGVGASFSISHSGSVAVCGAALDLRVGLDIEQLDRWPQAMEARALYLGARELDELAAIASASEREQFLITRWTIKEAYSKARGLGSQLPFNQIEVVNRGEEWRLTFGPDIHDDNSQWSISLIDQLPGYALAVVTAAAVRGTSRKQNSSF